MINNYSVVVVVVQINLRKTCLENISTSPRTGFFSPHDKNLNLNLMCISALGGVGSKLKWLISWPLLLLLYLTVPNCAKPRWERCFMLSFILSTVWIAVFSYFMVWMVSVIALCVCGKEEMNRCSESETLVFTFTSLK